MADPPELELLERTRFERVEHLRVQSAGDRFAAGALAEKVAGRLRLPARVGVAARIAAGELARSLLRQPGGGTLAVAASPETNLLRLSAGDRGSATDLERSLLCGAPEDGNAIGTGLGALRRLALLLVVEQAADCRVLTAYFGVAAPRDGLGCPVVVRAPVARAAGAR